MQLAVAAGLAAAILAGPAAAAPLAAQASPGPQPAPPAPPIPEAQDTPYPGVLTLLADLTDTAHRVIDVRETIPVAPGPITLFYPQWIPGNHAPVGASYNLAGLKISAGGHPLLWVRDPADAYAFHLDVPPGRRELKVEFRYLSPIVPAAGRISISSQIADLAWNSVLLYPAGHFSRRIEFSPSVRLPAGWQYATALETASRQGDLIHFAETPLNTLVDSPLYGGANYRRIDLSPDAGNPVFLDLFADSPADLAMTPEELAMHRRLAQEEARLFASHHYSHYDLLLLLSNEVGGIGLEHHQSSENGLAANYLTDWAAGVPERDLLAHEYTHSWNGKFRRPADLWTPNFNTPMRDDLLWVYEGLTQYYGFVLTARSGMRTAEQTRDLWAAIAANLAASAGRDWRPLADTTNQPAMAVGRPLSWISYQRGDDYYNEGLLLWLDVDTTIRERSGGKRSLDDFARLFYGMDNGSYITRTYTLDDLVAALNRVQPADWMAFFQQRVYRLAPDLPLDGFTRGGYRLAYSDHLPDWLKEAERAVPGRAANFGASLGFMVSPSGAVGDVWWDSLAFHADINPGARIDAVNDQPFSVRRLRAALIAGERDKSPLQLSVTEGGNQRRVSLDYHGGLRIPYLQRTDGAPDLLDDILAPSAAPAGPSGPE